METLNNYHFPVEDKSIEIFHDYLKNNYVNNFLAFFLILTFAIVFNFIYLAVDSFTDKKKHYQLALEAYLKYEANIKKRKQVINHLVVVDQDDVTLSKEEIHKRERKIEFTAWSYKNLHISFIHSVLCSLWLLKIFFNDQTTSDLLSDLLTYVSWDTYLLLAFSCGYFLYDFYDIYSNGNVKREWAVCLHHWTVLVSFTYHMVNLLNVGYSVLALLMEFNSIFLHSRKLLKFYSFNTNSFVCKLNSALNFITFVIFRFGVLVMIVHGIITQGHRVTFEYLMLLSSCTLIMFVINILLFKRLFKSDWSKKNKQ